MGPSIRSLPDEQVSRQGRGTCHVGGCEFRSWDCRKIGGVRRRWRYLGVCSLSRGWTRGLDCDGGENRG